jgi:hypothetical protein
MTTTENTSTEIINTLTMRRTQREMCDYYKSKPYNSKMAYDWLDNYYRNYILKQYGYPKHLKNAMSKELNDRCAAVNN